MPTHTVGHARVSLVRATPVALQACVRCRPPQLVRQQHVESKPKTAHNVRRDETHNASSRVNKTIARAHYAFCSVTEGAVELAPASEEFVPSAQARERLRERCQFRYHRRPTGAADVTGARTADTNAPPSLLGGKQMDSVSASIWSHLTHAARAVPTGHLRDSAVLRGEL